MAISLHQITKSEDKHITMKQWIFETEYENIWDFFILLNADDT